MTDHYWKEFAAPYALGALDRVESAEFERHLETCAECQAEVQSFKEAANRLAEGVTPATPPPEVRERVLREARQVRPLAQLAPPPAAPPAPPIRRRPTALIWVSVAAAAAVLVAIAGWYGYIKASSDAFAMRDSLAVAQAQRDSTRQMLATLLDSTTATTDFAATGKAPTMRLYWNRGSNVVVVAAFDLPPAPAGRAYQLWAIRKGRAPVSIGVFNSTSSGRAVATLHMPPDVVPEASAVTEEPFRGSPQPTQQPFLVAAWSLK